MPINNLEEKRQKLRDMGWSDAKIRAYEQSRGIGGSTFERTPTPSPQAPTPKAGFLEKGAPAITSLLGGALGPVGTGLGFSIGHSGQRVAKEMRTGGQDVLANLIGRSKSQDLTPYAQKKTKKLGLTGQQTPEMIKQLSQRGEPATETRDFELGKEATKQAVSKEGAKRAGGFVLENALKSSAAGVSDALFQKAFSALGSKIKQKFPSLNIRGVTPKAATQSADELAMETWKPIQSTLDDATQKGTRIDVTDQINMLENQGMDLLQKFGGEGGESVVGELTGIDKVRNELIQNSTKIVDDAGNVKYVLTPQGAQKTASYFGKTVRSPVSKRLSMSSDVLTDSINKYRKMVGPEIRDKVVNTLAEEGLENADELYKSYGIYRNFSNTVGRKWARGAMESGIVGTALGSMLNMLGIPVPGAAVTAGTMATMMPFGRQLLREGAQAPFRYLVPPATRAATGGIINRVMNPSFKKNPNE